jgi:hypothetical protein
MLRARSSVLIAASPQQVFELVAIDFLRNYRRWSPEVQRLELLTPGPLQVGSRVRQVRLDYGCRSDTTFRVLHLDPPERVSFAEVSGQYHIDYAVEPAGHKTRLTFVVELLAQGAAPPPAGAAASPSGARRGAAGGPENQGTVGRRNYSLR